MSQSLDTQFIKLLKTQGGYLYEGKNYKLILKYPVNEWGIKYDIISTGTERSSEYVNGRSYACLTVTDLREASMSTLHFSDILKFLMYDGKIYKVINVSHTYDRLKDNYRVRVSDIFLIDYEAPVYCLNDGRYNN